MHVPDLAGLYLEDSYVLAISETPRRLSFMLDAVLTPAHPRYRAPLPGEQHCYATGVLIFEGITTIEWIRRSHSDPSTPPATWMSATSTV